MAFGVEHTGRKEELILQLSWGMYKQDGTLLEMGYYHLEPTGLYIYIYIYMYTCVCIYIYIYIYQPKSK